MNLLFQYFLCAYYFKSDEYYRTNCSEISERVRKFRKEFAEFCIFNVVSYFCRLTGMTDATVLQLRDELQAPYEALMSTPIIQT